jgi:hypothetical protein
MRRQEFERHPRVCPRRVEFLAAEVAWSAAHDPNDYDRIVQRNPIQVVQDQDPA